MHILNINMTTTDSRPKNINLLAFDEPIAVWEAYLIISSNFPKRRDNDRCFWDCACLIQDSSSILLAGVFRKQSRTPRTQCILKGVRQFLHSPLLPHNKSLALVPLLFPKWGQVRAITYPDSASIQCQPFSQE